MHLARTPHWKPCLHHQLRADLAAAKTMARAPAFLAIARTCPKLHGPAPSPSLAARASRTRTSLPSRILYIADVTTLHPSNSRAPGERSPRSSSGVLPVMASPWPPARRSDVKRRPSSASCWGVSESNAVGCLFNVAKHSACVRGT